MTFALGVASEAQLVGVHPRLVAVIRGAIKITSQDFTVLEGLRLLERQRLLLAKGATRTLNSLHLKQLDGFGHAADLVPFDQTPRWEWPLIYPVAHAMQVAALGLGERIVWGGVWDRVLTDLEPTVEGLQAAVHAYSARHPGPDFLDGPHYQLAA